MGKNNNILIIITCLCIASISFSCATTENNTLNDNETSSSQIIISSFNPSDIGEYRFPVDEYGYPKTNTILINGVNYQLDSHMPNFEPNVIPNPMVIEIQKSSKITIAIAESEHSTAAWYSENTKGITIVPFVAHYNKEIRKNDYLCGSSKLKIFEVIAEDNAEEIILNYVITLDNNESYRVISQRIIIKLKTE